MIWLYFFLFCRCISALVGCALEACIVGVVFAKFQMPAQRAQTLLFSTNAVVSSRDGHLVLLFRVGNVRKSLIMQLHVRILQLILSLQRNIINISDFLDSRTSRPSSIDIRTRTDAIPPARNYMQAGQYERQCFQSVACYGLPCEKSWLNEIY